MNPPIRKCVVLGAGIVYARGKWETWTRCKTTPKPFLKYSKGHFDVDIIKKAKI